MIRAPWSREHRRKWRRLIRFLAAAFPIGRVEVWRLPLKCHHGTVVPLNPSPHRDDGFRIRIRSADTFDVAVDTLLEEWAHAMTTWDHTASWGMAYAKLRRAWETWSGE